MLEKIISLLRTDKPENILLATELAKAYDLPIIENMSAFPISSPLRRGYYPTPDLSAYAGLKNLRELWLPRRQIADISGIAEFTKLSRLGLYNNQISDISALAGLKHLNLLFLEHNQISDITPLLGLKPMFGIDLTGNPLEIAQIEELKKAMPNTLIKFGGVMHGRKEEVRTPLKKMQFIFNYDCSKPNPNKGELFA
jgi:Leucine-rich repeat (LRR) protein